MSLLKEGSRLDQYEIQELVAETATASIFRAIDTNSRCQVALKIPHTEVEGDPLFYSRFCRERKIGLKLNHPAVVKVLADERPGSVYLAMEWAEGRLLRDILHDGKKLPQDRAVSIALALCDALEYLHSQGVVHRDLKPENIIVDEQDRIKVIDFGIASERGARRLTFGKLSQVMGSPDYISPEQVKGKRGDARSDIYALGVILYEMLAGKTPFSGKNPFAVMNSRLVNHPVPPREVNPEISLQLQEIIYRALARDPGLRYASARELAWDLRHPDRVVIHERAEARDWKRGRTVWVNPVFLYSALAMIPVSIFALLLFIARHT